MSASQDECQKRLAEVRKRCLEFSYFLGAHFDLRDHPKAPQENLKELPEGPKTLLGGDEKAPRAPKSPPIFCVVY